MYSSEGRGKVECPPFPLSEEALEVVRAQNQFSNFTALHDFVKELLNDNENYMGDWSREWDQYGQISEFYIPSEPYAEYGKCVQEHG